MKKRRSTVYVRPGKDVTLYIPSDTTPEVIDYLNRLKNEGVFSQGVIDIVTRYVMEKRPIENPAMEAPVALSYNDSVPAELHESDRTPEKDESGSGVGPGDDNPIPESSTKFSLAQIFRQARHNSGKLLNDSERGGH
ncbi:hypothetical protein AB6A23_00715 [Paenibacillus tarimensis]